MAKTALLLFIRWLPLLLVLGVPLLYIIAERLYDQSVSPDGVETIQDHFDRFGTPEFVFQVERQGRRGC